MNRSGELPQHIAVIMDGNGRWAQQKGAARVFGHKNAIQAVRETVECCAELGVGHLTLFAFSTENWERPKSEIDMLMGLLVSTIEDELPTLLKNNIRLRSIGDFYGLPTSVQGKLRGAIEQTAHNTGMELILALNYSGKWDILQAFELLCQDDKDKLGHPIKTSDLERHLSTFGIPDPELLIRTSGEIRLSNFYLWQLAYTELYFTSVLWPDFRKKHLLEAIEDYQKRERRFGKTSEQVNA
jgi:undecaprenyl diphosphate synthase